MPCYCPDTHKSQMWWIFTCLVTVTLQWCGKNLASHNSVSPGFFFTRSFWVLVRDSVWESGFLTNSLVGCISHWTNYRELWCCHCLTINCPDNEAGECRFQTLDSYRFNEDKPIKGLWNTVKFAVTKLQWKKHIIKNTPLERISFNLLHTTHH